MSTNTNSVVVWEPLIRIFHWSLVVAFFISYMSADENESIHVYSGYTILGLIVFRIIWGLIGGKYARFSQFIRSPKAAFTYLKGLVNKNSIEYIGHNPAGGWMVLSFLMCLSLIIFSGLKVYALEEGKGLLSQSKTEISLISSAYADNKHSTESKDEDAEEFWEDIHELSVNLMLFLILLHVIGVFVSSKAHNSNLVKAMITGEKTVRSNKTEKTI